MDVASSEVISSETTSNKGGQKVSCALCSMRFICIAAGSDRSSVREIDKLVIHWHPMDRGKHIFREGDEFRQAFVVRSGAVKTYQTLESGEEQITGFMLPGDVFGIEGLASQHHISGAIALETTSVCAIPLQNLLAPTQEARLAERQVLTLLSESLNRKDSHTLMLAMNKAHERIAAFLVDISDRLANRKLSAVEFSLAMSRCDISKYLGLSQESVSRGFARLSKEGLITSKGREIRILDYPALRQLAGRPQERTLQRAS